MALIDDRKSPVFHPEAKPSVTTVKEKSDVRQTIERVWAEMMPFAAEVDESVAWRETGADSLLTLQFLVRLEQTLKRPLSFDMFTLDMTVGEIIRTIEQSLTPDQDATPKQAPAYPTLFLVPGVHGDEPKLAEFRRSLADVLRFETLDLPDIDQTAALLSSMSASAEFLMRQISAKQPDGPILLAGFSIGGVLAFEIAEQMKAAGRDVRFICILDSLYVGKIQPTAEFLGVDTPPEASGRTLSSRLKKKEGEKLSVYFDRLVYGTLVRLGQFESARRWAVARTSHNSFAVNLERRKFLLLVFRGGAIQSWKPKPSSTPALLITSDDFPKTDSMETWTTLCPNLTVQAVPGNHHQIFAPQALAKLNPALLAALDQAGAGNPA